MTATTRLFRPLSSVAFVLALGAGFSFQLAEAASPYDGSWSVALVAENGNCRASTVAIEVADGKVRYVGAFAAVAEGAVRPDGVLSVTFSHKAATISARGSVDETFGFGSWSSPTQSCDGTWTARKG